MVIAVSVKMTDMEVKSQHWGERQESRTRKGSCNKGWGRRDLAFMVLLPYLSR